MKFLVIEESLQSQPVVLHTHIHEPALECAHFSNSHSLLGFKNCSWNNNHTNKMVFIYSSLS